MNIDSVRPVIYSEPKMPEDARQSNSVANVKLEDLEIACHDTSTGTHVV